MTDKSILEKAATSPDPIVRHAAVRRLEIDNEVTRLDTFLGFYAESQTGTPVTGPSVTREPAEPKARPKGTRAKSQKIGKGPRLADAAVSVLAAHGKPMQLQDLFAVLKTEHADICPPKLDSLRPRLHEQREKVAMIKGRGYWPVGLAEPL